MPRMNIDGASAIVTGGASGLGEACARQLAELGAHVVIADLQEDRGQAVASEIKGTFVRCDVSSEADAAAAVEAAGQLGPLRVLINSAGLGRAARTVDRDNAPMKQSTFELVIRVNLLGTFNMLRQAAAAMAKTDPLDSDGARGAIVNMASVAAFDGQTGQAAYSASKGGIVGMTLPIARDLSAVGVRVNTVAPGLIDTPIYGSGEDAEKFKAHLGASVLFPKRLGSAEELAFTVIECVTNPYLNGETIRVDGGIRLPAK
jgi:NAD(P)-dependent dehydrogenase (short-subunit alcohol dehydrogenase family)